ncbi:hypothetical protein [Leptolyngbya subtilissima]
MVPVCKGRAIALKYGPIVDTALIPLPKRSNTQRENKTIKQGEVPSE